MMPHLIAWIGTQEVVVLAVLTLGSIVIWLWHHRLNHAPHPSELTPMSVGWLTQKHLHEHEHR